MHEWAVGQREKERENPKQTPRPLPPRAQSLTPADGMTLRSGHDLSGNQEGLCD